MPQPVLTCSSLQGKCSMWVHVMVLVVPISIRIHLWCTILALWYIYWWTQQSTEVLKWKTVNNVIYKHVCVFCPMCSKCTRILPVKNCCDPLSSPIRLISSTKPIPCLARINFQVLLTKGVSRLRISRYSHWRSRYWDTNHFMWTKFAGNGSQQYLNFYL